MVLVPYTRRNGLQNGLISMLANALISNAQQNKSNAFSEHMEEMRAQNQRERDEIARQNQLNDMDAKRQQDLDDAKTKTEQNNLDAGSKSLWWNPGEQAMSRKEDYEGPLTRGARMAGMAGVSAASGLGVDRGDAPEKGKFPLRRESGGPPGGEMSSVGGGGLPGFGIAGPLANAAQSAMAAAPKDAQSRMQGQAEAGSLIPEWAQKKNAYSPESATERYGHARDLAAQKHRARMSEIEAHLRAGTAKGAALARLKAEYDRERDALYALTKPAIGVGAIPNPYPGAGPVGGDVGDVVESASNAYRGEKPKKNKPKKNKPKKNKPRANRPRGGGGDLGPNGFDEATKRYSLDALKKKYPGDWQARKKGLEGIGWTIVGGQGGRF